MAYVIAGSAVSGEGKTLPTKAAIHDHGRGMASSRVVFSIMQNLFLLFKCSENCNSNLFYFIL